MYQYGVDQIIPEYCTHKDGIYFDMTDSGAQFVMLFGSPTVREIEAIKGGRLEFGLYAAQGAIFVLIKAGELPWMDAPYCVHLSKHLTRQEQPTAGMGYGCTIIAADSNTGRIKALRLVGLSNEYSTVLKDQIDAQSDTGFNPVGYTAALERIMASVSTKQMVEQSLVNCIIG